MRYKLSSTQIFDKWLDALKDRTTKNKVLARLDRIGNGSFGDFKPLGNGLSELRFFFGGGLTDLLHYPWWPGCSVVGG